MEENTMEPGSGAAGDLFKLAQQGRKSTLFKWMLDHHDEFATALKIGGQPDWPALAEGFEKAELRDLRGNFPTAEICRRTWKRARRHLANPTFATRDLEPSKGLIFRGLCG
jgi:hypothetical protein